jgi:Cft2 family RNA processing exonuclease
VTSVPAAPHCFMTPCPLSVRTLWSWSRRTATGGKEIIRTAVERKAKILVPVFAIGRTQLLLYLLAGAFRQGTLPRFPVYVDSPMAIEATRIYGRNTEIFDVEAKAMLESGELRRNLETVRPAKAPTSRAPLTGWPAPA